MAQSIHQHHQQQASLENMLKILPQQSHNIKDLLDSQEAKLHNNSKNSNEHVNNNENNQNNVKLDVPKLLNANNENSQNIQQRRQFSIAPIQTKHIVQKGLMNSFRSSFKSPLLCSGENQHLSSFRSPLLRTTSNNANNEAPQPVKNTSFLRSPLLQNSPLFKKIQDFSQEIHVLKKSHSVQQMPISNNINQNLVENIMEDNNINSESMNADELHQQQQQEKEKLLQKPMMNNNNKNNQLSQLNDVKIVTNITINNQFQDNHLLSVKEQNYNQLNTMHTLLNLLQQSKDQKQSQQLPNSFNQQQHQNIQSPTATLLNAAFPQSPSLLLSQSPSLQNILQQATSPLLNAHHQNLFQTPQTFSTQGMAATPLGGGQKKFTCNCKKTKCLKLYCECFAHGEVCAPSCNCTECSNITTNAKVKASALETAITIMQQPPGSTFSKKKKGCNCKKSNCLKKYCECYNEGVGCSEICKCEDCKNKKENYINGSFQQNEDINENLLLNSSNQSTSNQATNLFKNNQSNLLQNLNTQINSSISKNMNCLSPGLLPKQNLEHIEQFLLKKKLKSENEALLSALQIGQQYFAGLENAVILESKIKEMIDSQQNSNNQSQS